MYQQRWAADRPGCLIFLLDQSGARTNFPPAVVNIASCAATDGDPREPAGRLRRLATDDGATLLFNCQVSAQQGGVQVRYPSDARQVPQLPEAMTLFEMSSALPDPMREYANASYGMGLAPGARGFVCGGDIRDLVQFFTCASLPKTDR